jgi:transcriptional regulator with GAF, ATPase, and Fis domain
MAAILKARQLLRVLQEQSLQRAVQRAGGREPPISIDGRIIAATQRDLKDRHIGEAISRGPFSKRWDSR